MPRTGADQVEDRPLATTGSAPTRLTSSAWSGLRIKATASSPRCDKTLARRRVIWPCRDLGLPFETALGA
jgi:hypothetical protein